MPPTQVAPDMHWGPLLSSQAAPSAAAAMQVPWVAPWVVVLQTPVTHARQERHEPGPRQGDFSSSDPFSDGVWLDFWVKDAVRNYPHSRDGMRPPRGIRLSPAFLA